MANRFSRAWRVSLGAFATLALAAGLSAPAEVSAAHAASSAAAPAATVTPSGAVHTDAPSTLAALDLQGLAGTIMQAVTHPVSTTCRATHDDCFPLVSASGKQLRVTDKYFPGKGRYVRDRNEGGTNYGSGDWRLKQVQPGKVNDKGKFEMLPGKFKLWSWFETERCLDTRDVNVDVIMWPCNGQNESRQWWHVQLAPDSVMQAKGLKPASEETGANMLFMIRNAQDKNRCLTAGNPAIVATCDPSASNPRGADQLFSVNSEELAEKLKQMAVDYQNAVCAKDKSCEITARPDATPGTTPDPILAYGCASIADKDLTKGGVVMNNKSEAIDYTFTRRVSEAHTHRWNFGVDFMIGSGEIDDVLQRYSLQLRASYGGEWTGSKDEETTVSHKVAAGSYGWEVRGVPQLPTLVDIDFNKREGLTWSVDGTGTYMVNGNDRVQPILVFNEAPASQTPAPTCNTMTVPPLGTGSLPQILRDGQHLGKTPPAVGVELTATPAEWNIDHQRFDFTYQWFADERVIVGATSANYRVDENDVGSALKVRVTTKRSGFISANATSMPTAPVVEKSAGGAPGDGPGDPGSDPGDGNEPGKTPVTDPGTDPGTGPGDGDTQQLNLKTAVSSGPFTTAKPPFFTVQVLLPDRAPLEVLGTVRATWNGQELVSQQVSVRDGRTMASLQLPTGVLAEGEQTIEITFTPDDETQFEQATTKRVITIEAAGMSDEVGDGD